jgi:hypothetical protein
MPDDKVSGRCNATADGRVQQFAATLESIAEHLRAKHADIVHEPLPEAMIALLGELQQRRDDG